MPQEQANYHSNRTGTNDEARQGENETTDGIDQAIQDAKKRSGSVTCDVATDWLDDIDEALEEWAESDELAKAFVAAYVQKGGQ